MPDQHARISPSSAKMFSACAQSLLQNERFKDIIPDEGSPFALEGTKAHAVGEAKLRKLSGEYDDDAYKKAIAEVEKEFGPIAKDMDQYTDVYKDIIEEKLYAARQTCPDAELFVETRVSMERWIKDCWGTSDAVIVGDDIMEVCDLKYGTGVKVEAEHNPQARLYGLGALDLYGSIYGFKKIRNTIIQVRLDHITEETLTRKELIGWMENEFKPAIDLALSGTGPFTPGPHCKFCRVRPICIARVQEALKAFYDGTSKVGVIDDDMVPGILKIADTTISWLKDVQDYARTQALNGKEWKGYKLVQGRPGNRSFDSSDAVTELLTKAGYDKSIYSETKLLSVSKMESALGKKTVANLLGDHIVRPAGSTVLVPDSDKREAIVPDKDIFNQLIDNN